MLPLLVLLGTFAGAWYLLIVRPQRHQQTRHGHLLDRLQVGDHVLTVGGIYGRITSIEGSSVVLELAPGLATRIASDGVARIVHAGEGALPSTPDQQRAQDAPTDPSNRNALDTDMQHQHDQQHAHAPAPAFAAPAWVAPPQPYAPAAQQPAGAPAPVPTTLRAQVTDPIPSFEPRPWSDLAPRNAPQPGAWQQPAPVAHAPAHVAQPVPMHVPFAAHAAPAPATAVAPQAPQAHPHPYPQQHLHYHAPVVAPVVAHAPATHVAAPAPAAPDTAPARRHSRAPQGMGSSLRLDDPSLRDVLARARDERSGLAEEYRKLTAPLVDVGEQAEPASAAFGQAPPAPAGAVLVGHDPAGVPLFAAPGAPLAHPVAPQYPAPVRVDGAAPMPRPVVQAPPGGIDPALTSSAFQRRAPYAPAAAHA